MLNYLMNMKSIKYLLLFAFAACAVIACQKHVLTYAPSNPADDMAMFQITYVEPIAVNASNAIDSVFVNDKLVASSKGVGQLAVNGTYPYGPAAATSKFFAAAPGSIKIQFYRRGNEVYNKTVDLEAGKWELFVYSLNEDPVVFDNLYPYKGNPERGTVETFNTDSIARIRFYNFAFLGDNTTPYPGKIQYQWGPGEGTKRALGEWHNIGEPVGFGEATAHEIVHLGKEVFNSEGYDYLYFRGVDEQGNEVIESDYWTTYIGSTIKHIYRGVVGGSPEAGITLSGSLR